MDFNDIVDSISVKPYYLDREAGQVIYCSDCRLVLPLIPDKSIDLVLTDPPYGIGIDRSFNDDLGEVGALNSLVGDGKLIMFTSPRRVADIINLLEWNFARMLWWYKPNDIAHSWHGFQMVSEAIMVFTRGKVIFPKDTGKSYHDTIIECNEKQNLHPCHKPIKVVAPLLEHFSNPNDLILDPFLGSGTTAYCAKKLGRKCIGIEIEEKYCEIAAKRLSQSVMRLEV